MQNALPENKTHFLNEITVDLVIPNKAKPLQVSEQDNIKPTIKSPEKSSVTNDDLSKNTLKDLKATENKKQIIQPVISETIKQTPVSINKVIEAMDIESDVDSYTEENNEVEDSNVMEMLKDFIDSD